MTENFPHDGVITVSYDIRCSAKEDDTNIEFRLARAVRRRYSWQVQLFAMSRSRIQKSLVRVNLMNRAKKGGVLVSE